MDEDDVREVRLYHWLSETAGTRFMQDSALTRADSPLLGFDHHLTQPYDLDSNKVRLCSHFFFYARRLPSSLASPALAARNIPSSATI
jgi:hypothetical protein